MKAVFKNELATYFSTITGYVFGAFILLFIGIYMTSFNLKAMYPEFEYALGSMTVVFLIAIPILTMRVIAEERRQKTDQLLYSLPISMTEVVMGKFFALMVTFAAPLLLVATYPILLKKYGPVYLPTSYGAMLGLLMLGAALLAMGLFISSITENQAVAAGVCLAVMLLNYFMSSLAGYVPSSARASFIAFAVLLLALAAVLWFMTKNPVLTGGAAIIAAVGLIVYYRRNTSAFECLFAKVIGELSLFEKYNIFVEGILDLRVIIYDLSVAGFFLFLTVQSMEKRRWQG